MAKAAPARSKKAPARKAPARKAPAKKAATRKRAPRVTIAETPEGLIEPGIASEFPTPIASGVARSGFWPPMVYWMKVATAFVLVGILYLAIVQIIDVLVLLVISFVLGLGMQPSIKALVRRGMKRGWAVTIILVVALLVIVAFLALVIPAIVREVGGLVEKLSTDYLESAEGKASIIGRLNEQFDLQAKLADFADEVPSAALGLVKSFTSLIFNFLTVMILTAIISIRLPSMKRGIARLLRREQREDFDEILEESIDRVGGYVVGNLATSGIAGVFTFVFALVLGIPYGAALGFGMALFDLIPTIGALLGLVAITLIAFLAKGNTIAIVTAVVFIAYQQLENYVIQPRVMKKAIDMSPGAVIIAVLIGGSLAGILGSLLALPIAAIIKIAVNELFIEERLEAIRRTETPPGSR